MESRELKQFFSILREGRLAVGPHSVCVGPALSVNNQGKEVNGKGTKLTDDSKWISEVNTKAEFEDIYKQWVIKWQITFPNYKQRKATVYRELLGKSR